ncbi:hypothetical protein [Amycolatopsis marina]|nr:hypothetical protein [Amycolatopsis marina]
MTEVPTALRPATSRPGRPERRVKPQVQADQSARQVVSQPVSHEEQPRVVADEAAWEVQTPGGPVVSARRQEQERRQAEPPPTFGAAN